MGPQSMQSDVPDETADTAAVLVADDLRRRATEQHDADTLASLLLPDFSYVHMTGHRESGFSYLRRLRAADTVRFHAVERRSAHVRLFGDVAVMEGEANLRYESPIGSAPKNAASQYLAVWVRHSGVWRMASYASTALPSQS